MAPAIHAAVAAPNWWPATIQPKTIAASRSPTASVADEAREDRQAVEREIGIGQVDQRQAAQRVVDEEQLARVVAVAGRLPGLPACRGRRKARSGACRPGRWW
ncbi:hypothetical protein G6F63_015995 [Rhizopus arrhizus]|nr:hypothetical protein G6F63_015995 [Rhizopus arrhizus]